MYSFGNSPTNLGEFGIIWQGIVGTIQAIGYATAAGQKYSATKKYLSSQERTQKIAHEAKNALKEGELALREQTLIKDAQKQIYEDQRIKRLVIISAVIVLVVAVVGLGSYYFLAVE